MHLRKKSILRLLQELLIYPFKHIQPLTAAAVQSASLTTRSKTEGSVSCLPEPWLSSSQRQIIHLVFHPIQ